MEYRRGDIVLVNFNPQKKPEEIAKIRPAIIVSDSGLNQVMDLVSVIALTTNLINDAEPLRIRVAKREHLEFDSDVMVEQLRAVSKERIGQRVASVTEDEMNKIASGIKEMLVLS